MFIGRTDAEAEAPILGHLMRRTDSLEKSLMLGKTEGGGERGMTEDELVGWHHRHDGHEFEQTLEDGEGEGSPVCCTPWAAKSWTGPSNSTAAKIVMVNIQAERA